MSYFFDSLEFRNKCAEAGVELTPQEAKVYYKGYKAFRKQIKKARKACPNFYMEICNRTTEQKLEDIERLSKQGCIMSLREYNELQSMIKSLCEIEGYD